jgi:hypothetical protein
MQFHSVFVGLDGDRNDYFVTVFVNDRTGRVFKLFTVAHLKVGQRFVPAD